MNAPPPRWLAALRLQPALLMISAALSLALAPTLLSAQCVGGACHAPDRSAQFQPSATSYLAVVRIIAPNGSSTSYGSGSLIEVGENYGLIITNWHVVAEATGQVKVVFADGFCAAANVVKIDHHWDLAALLIHHVSVSPLPLATDAPRPGDLLTIAGYGMGTFRSAVGRCTQYVSPGQNSPYEMVELSAEARQGDSGGPILNTRGEIAGVLFGASRGTTTGSYVGRLRWFIADIDRPAPSPREEALVNLSPIREATSPNTPGWISRHNQSNDTAPQEPTPSPGTNSLPSEENTSDQFAHSEEISLDPHENEATESPLPLEIHWTDLAGKTLWEQAKTFLAIVGAITILMQLAGSSTQKE